MNGELRGYFEAEKRGGAVLAAMGGASLVLAGGLWVAGGALAPAAGPLAAIGLAEVGMGGGLILRTPAQLEALEAGFGREPSGTAEAELTRMTRVNRSLRVLQGAELALLAVGTSLAFAMRSPRPAWAAVGLGLALQAAALLVFDARAARRARSYTRWLRGIRTASHPS